MGGTSTDVSRFAGRYEITYETTTAGISIQSPQLDINTVAAGGGSCLTFRHGLFKAGPESAGAEPGPACYRYGIPQRVLQQLSSSQKGRATRANGRQSRIRPTPSGIFPKDIW